MSFDLAKHGLNFKKGFKTNLVSFLENQKNGNEGEEEEEEERKKRRGGAQAKRYGTTNFEYGLGFLVWILGFVWLMVCPKPRV